MRMILVGAMVAVVAMTGPAFGGVDVIVANDGPPPGPPPVSGPYNDSNPSGRVIIADGRNHVELTDRRYDIILDNCRRFLADQPLRNLVDKARWF